MNWRETWYTSSNFSLHCCVTVLKILPSSFVSVLHAHYANSDKRNVSLFFPHKASSQIFLQCLQKCALFRSSDQLFMHVAVHLFKAAPGPQMSGEARRGRELLIVWLISFRGVIILVCSRKSQRVALCPPSPRVPTLPRQMPLRRALKEVITECDCSANWVFSLLDSDPGRVRPPNPRCQFAYSCRSQEAMWGELPLTTEHPAVGRHGYRLQTRACLPINSPRRNVLAST